MAKNIMQKIDGVVANIATTASQVTRTDGKSVQDFFDNGGTIYGNIIMGKTLEHTASTLALRSKPATIGSKVNYFRENYTNNGGNPAVFWRIEEDTLNSGANQCGVYMLKHLDANTGIFAPYNDNVVQLGSTGRKWQELHLAGLAKSENGYTKLPNGIIIQWGFTTGKINASGGVMSKYINYPIAFPSKCCNVSANIDRNTTTNNIDFCDLFSVLANDNTLTNFRLAGRALTTGVSTSNTFKFTWFAVGY